MVGRSLVFVVMRFDDDEVVGDWIKRWSLIHNRDDEDDHDDGIVVTVVVVVVETWSCRELSIIHIYAARASRCISRS